MGREIAEVFCLFGLYFSSVVESTLLEFRVDQHFRRADPRQILGAEMRSMDLVSGNHIPVYALLPDQVYCNWQQGYPCTVGLTSPLFLPEIF